VKDSLEQAASREALCLVSGSGNSSLSEVARKKMHRVEHERDSR